MTGPRILVIDDETPIRRFLAIALGSGGFEVSEAERGRRGVELVATSAPDAVILDLGLPDMDGKAVITAIREWSQVPILILSVRDGEAEKIAALDAGADDYVTKPFATGELMARLRALLRKRPASAPEKSEISVGGLLVNLATRSVEVDGLEAKLTRKEFDVLALLARNTGRLVGHRQILTTIWGSAHVEDTHYLRIAIGHIREKIGDDAANPRFIVTEPGVGYRLKSDESGHPNKLNNSGIAHNHHK
jgi:DNA-binding response OmpR family regulator